MSADFILDRCEAIPALIGNHRDFLIIAGLAGTAKDTAALTEDGDHLFALAGAMGGACMIGLGLALAQPEKKILVVTGDGELLMNIGCLASIALVNPANLSILCVDNGHYGETGYQRSHTSFDTNLEQMAQGAGLTATRTITTAEQIPDGARLLREANGTSFVVARVKPTPPPKVRRNMDPSACRHRFRAALLTEG
jgi:thiamine pyrophosphate-dependent acetolactate synthase large subunit-like protein